MKIRQWLIILLVLFPIYSTQAEENSIKVIKNKANTILHQQVLPNLHILAKQDGQEINKKNTDNAVLIQTTSFTGLEDFDKPPQTEINFFGSKVQPDTSLFVSFALPEKVEKETKADAGGSWLVIFPINALPRGNHTAYLQTEVSGVRSELQAVATFKVTTTQQISSKTWFFIIFVTFAIFILLLAIILQLRRNAHDLEPGELI